MAKNLYIRLKLIIRKLKDWARKISIPGFDRIPLYDVLVFFYRSIADGAITTRASAIAFNYFLALFPAVIFFFTLIAYVPVENFQNELFQLIHDFLPQNTFVVVEETIRDILTHQRGDLLSLGFFMALYFSSNGLVSMMNAFDASLHINIHRRWYSQRLVSILLLLILFVLLTLAVSFITVGQYLINFAEENQIIGGTFTYYLLTLVKWLIIIGLLFFAYSFVYFYAPAKKTRWRFISAGGTLATFLSIVVLSVFSNYITNFGRYNTLYGSIGTLLVVLFLLYLISLILLIGFELNASLSAARRNATDIINELEAQEKALEL